MLPPSFDYRQHEVGNAAEFAARYFNLAGPAYGISTACSSSGKVFASARGLIAQGYCDAVIVGGADSLCELTLQGFKSLEAVSDERSNPFSVNRKGINIGEGAALFLMEATSAGAQSVELMGWGESSDGHHISAPDPAGAGARLAFEQALSRAGVDAKAIDYINMHGTATPQNDAMESRVIEALFGNEVTVSSTKPFTGHTLGAAAAIEAALCWLAMQDDNPQGRLPPHLWDGAADPALPALNLVPPGAALGRPLRRVLSSSFAFGGSNAVLLLGRSE